MNTSKTSGKRIVSAEQIAKMHAGKNRTSMAVKAGLTVHPMRMRRRLQADKLAKSISVSSGPFLAGLIEYLINEILFGTLEAAQLDKAKKLHPRHVVQAITSDEDFCHIFPNIIVAKGGVPLKTAYIQMPWHEEARKLDSKSSKPKSTKPAKPTTVDQDMEPEDDEEAEFEEEEPEEEEDEEEDEEMAPTDHADSQEY